MKYYALLFLILSNISFGGTIDPNVPDSKYIEYGKQYKCIFKLSGKHKDGKMFNASSVLITPKFILTAAHVAKDTENSYLITENNNKNTIKLFVIPEEYDENKFGGNGYDIAVGYLEKEIDIDFYPLLYTENNELDKVCGIAGYGVSGNFNTGITFSDEKKRAGSNIIERIDNNILLICSAQNKPTQLEILIAGGDSGGGLFIDQKLAGIHSSVYNEGKEKPSSNKRSFSVHTRVSSHINWIEKIIEELNNADIGGITRVDGK